MLGETWVAEVAAFANLALVVFLKIHHKRLKIVVDHATVGVKSKTGTFGAVDKFSALNSYKN